MRIVIIALGSRGDIQPYATLGKALRIAGHSVSFVTFENFASLVNAHNLDFLPIHGDSQALVNMAGADMFALLRTFNQLAEQYSNDLSDITPVIQKSNLLINQLPLGLYGYDLAEKFGVPMLMAGVMPLTRTSAFHAMGLAALPIPGYNQLSFRIAEQIIWQAYRPILNRWRKKSLGLSPISFGGYADKLGTVSFPMLYGFSEQVVPKPPDWGDGVHITGYWFPEDKAWQPSDDLQRFIESGTPPVFIGFGSMPIRNPEHTTRIILEAVRLSGQRAVLHVGWGGIGNHDLPDTIFKIDYVPYAWLFPRMSMVIHHGGSGTTGFALRSGVPSMVIPFLFDQFFWGECIYELGVGPQAIPFNQISVDKLANAIRIAANDSTMRERAADLGRKIAAEDGIGNAIRLIERYQ